MKKIITLLMLTSPGFAVAQSIHLPNAQLPPISSPNVTRSHANAKYHKSLLASDSSKIDTPAVTPTPTSPTGVSTQKYSAQVLSTNFTIPLVRVNFLVNKPQNANNALVSTSFFNSVGAGLNYAWGEITSTKDADGSDVSVDFTNQYGIQAGFLFASNGASGASTATQNANTQSSYVFAVVAGISILNFQVGGGYELGSLASGQRRGFMTIAYSIPVAALGIGGYKICKVTANSN